MDYPNPSKKHRVLHTYVYGGQCDSLLVKIIPPYDHVKCTRCINNKICNIDHSCSLLSSTHGLQGDVTLHLHSFPCASYQLALETFDVIKVQVKPFKSIRLEDGCGASLINQHSIIFVITPHSYDHGIIILRMDASCVSLRENDLILQCFLRGCNFYTRVILCLHCLVSCPS